MIRADVIVDPPDGAGLARPRIILAAILLWLVRSGSAAPYIVEEHQADAFAELAVSRASVSRISGVAASACSPASSRRSPGPLRTRETRRDHPSRHQEARPFQQHRPPHHRAPHRSLQQPKRRWEFVHVAVDDHSRIARADIFPDQKKESAVPSSSPLSLFKRLGVSVARVMTDNGSCYKSKAFTRTCKQLASSTSYQTLHAADQRQSRALHSNRAQRMGLRHSLRALSNNDAGPCSPWLRRYNWHRPHASLTKKPPISRLGLTGNNLLSLTTSSMPGSAYR